MSAFGVVEHRLRAQSTCSYTVKAAVPATCTCHPLPSDRFRWSSGRLRSNLVNDRLRCREILSRRIRVTAASLGPTLRN